MNDRLIQAENNIETIFDNIQQLRDQDQALKEYIDQNISDVRSEINNNQGEQGEQNEEFQKIFDRNEQVMQHHHKQHEKHHISQKQTNIALDKHDRELKGTNIKLDGTREDLIEKVHDTKEDLKDRLGELDKFYQEANEEINTEL